MLKRISNIQGIGSFANCNAGQAEFRKTSLVFGYNSYGKSTLTQIFRSIEIGDSSEIKSRLTIPGGNKQTALLKIFLGNKEESHTFDGTGWTGNDLGINWRVFDSGFINRNVITGDGVERNNKENLSKFVLGEEGVKKSAKIFSLKQEQRKVRSDYKKLDEQLNSLAGGNGVQVFVNLKSEHSKEKVIAMYDSEVTNLVAIRNNIVKLGELKARPIFGIAPSITPLHQLLKLITEELNVSITDVHNVAKERLNEHVLRHMNAGIGQRDWIQSGINFIKEDQCPFCEQELSENAKALISAYEAAFNDQLNLQTVEMKRKLDSMEQSLLRYAPENFTAAHDLNKRAVLLYPELADSPDVATQFLTLENISNKFIAAAEKHSKLIEMYVSDARASIHSKRNSIFEKFSIQDFSELEALEFGFADFTNDYNYSVDKINIAIEEFKASANIEKYRQQEQTTLAKVKALELIIKRLDNNVACQAYIDASDKLLKLNADIISAQEELESEQSAYLDKFFEKINNYFKIFGSRDFSISKEKDNKGDLPIYALSVKYKNNNIPLSKLGFVFSESDKRALALSIFWASLSVLDEDKLSKTIVVLDDPVTSFDDNRIADAIFQFRTMSNKLRQIIVLTHYSGFAKRFLDIEKVDGDFSLLMLEKGEKSTQLSIGKSGNFTDSEHHKKFENIQDFINRKQSNPIDSDLRVYLEEEVHNRYRRAISKLGIRHQMFSDLIDSLATKGEISPSTKIKLHSYREDLNSPHHKWTDRTPDDWSNYAQGLLDFIYTEL